MNIRIRTATLLAGVAALLLAVPAFGRAPTTAEKRGLDWMGPVLEAERQQDKTAPTLNPTLALIDTFQKGQATLDTWKQVAEIVKDDKVKASYRQRAVTALVDRVKAERGLDARTHQALKNEVCLDVLKLLLSDDKVEQSYVQQVVNGLNPRHGVDFKPGDSLSKRRSAYRDLYKKLK